MRKGPSKKLDKARNVENMEVCVRNYPPVLRHKSHITAEDE